jgi:hypothetical protein
VSDRLITWTESKSPSPIEDALLDLDDIYRHVRAALRDRGGPLPQKRDRNTSGELTLIRN